MPTFFFSGVRIYELLYTVPYIAICSSCIQTRLFVSFRILVSSGVYEYRPTLSLYDDIPL